MHVRLIEVAAVNSDPCRRQTVAEKSCGAFETKEAGRYLRCHAEGAVELGREMASAPADLLGDRFDANPTLMTFDHVPGPAESRIDRRAAAWLKVPVDD